MVDIIKEEIRNIGKKPIIIFFSSALMLFMLVLTVFAWDGISKRLLICLGLSILSGILLLLPRLSNWISVPLLVLYLCYVPSSFCQAVFC